VSSHGPSSSAAGPSSRTRSPTPAARRLHQREPHRREDPPARTAEGSTHQSVGRLGVENSSMRSDRGEWSASSAIYFVRHRRHATTPSPMTDQVLRRAAKRVQSRSLVICPEWAKPRLDARPQMSPPPRHVRAEHEVEPALQKPSNRAASFEVSASSARHGSSRNSTPAYMHSRGPPRRASHAAEKLVRISVRMHASGPHPMN